MMDQTAKQILGYQDQYNNLEARAAESSVTADLFEEAKRNIANRITGLLVSDVADDFWSHVPETVHFEEDLDVLRAAGVDEEALDNARQNADAGVLMGYIALKWLLPSADKTAAQPTQLPSSDTEPKPTPLSHMPLPELFNKKPKDVAKSLPGKVLVFGDKSLTIGEALGQSQADNKRWLSKPIFGSNPANAMVVNYRGNPMLFIRTGEQNSCIRLLSGLGTGGEKLINSKQVCEYLGLSLNTFGVQVEDVRVTLVPDPVEP